MQTLNETESVKTQLLEFDKKRDTMEKEMVNIVDLLENMNGNPGIKEPLVDDQGFPRGDVDIFEVRKLRNRYACLQTDHKNLMRELEQKLYSLHSVYQANGCKDEPHLPVKKATQDEEMKQEETQIVQKEAEKIPFVWIHDVVSGSPAEQDGIKIGDAIIQFG